jgi:hypothetical protein
MDIRAWAEQRVCYSRARRGRFERGAQIGECGIVQAMAFAMARRQGRDALLAALPAPAEIRPAASPAA